MNFYETIEQWKNNKISDQEFYNKLKTIVKPKSISTSLYLEMNFTYDSTSVSFFIWYCSAENEVEIKSKENIFKKEIIKDLKV